MQIIRISGRNLLTRSTQVVASFLCTLLSCGNRATKSQGRPPASSTMTASIYGGGSTGSADVKGKGGAPGLPPWPVSVLASSLSPSGMGKC